MKRQILRYNFKVNNYPLLQVQKILLSSRSYDDIVKK